MTWEAALAKAAAEPMMAELADLLTAPAELPLADGSAETKGEPKASGRWERRA